MHRRFWVRGQRRGSGAMAFALIAAVLLAACGGEAATVAPTAGASGAGAATTVANTAPAATTAATTGAVTTAPSTGATSATAAMPAGTAAPGAMTASGAMMAAGADPRGVAPAKRGGGGTLRLLYWQAPTILNLPLANGVKDQEAARLVFEPLASTSLNGSLPDVPVLAKEVPSLANGAVAADGKSVTWKLKDGVKWSDGTSFTSEDVKATWQYITKRENGAVNFANYDDIATIDTLDATTVRLNFKAATSQWYIPFTNKTGGVLQKTQIEKCTDAKACVINNAPIGTGPYKVKSFMTGDNVQYVINDNYREANAPFFDAVDLKGGGDAATAAKAVLTGQADYAWNLTITPDIAKQVTDGGKVFDQVPGSGIEFVMINFTDPTKEVEGEKSSLKAPHPFLTDPKVREAISYLIDRESIAKNLYTAGKATCNFIVGIPPAVQSKNTSCGFNAAKANQILDEAGWKRGGDGIREKGGVKLKVVAGTSVDAVREKEQQIIKQAFGQAGIAMEIKNAESGVFFGQPDNPDAASRAERDLLIFSRTVPFPDMQAYLSNYTTSQIAQKANGWKGSNYGRWSSPEYDALYTQLTKELDPTKRAQLQIQMNDLIVNSYAIIPMVDRYSNNGRRADLSNTSPTPWDATVWNIAYWQIKK